MKWSIYESGVGPKVSKISAARPKYERTARTMSPLGPMCDPNVLWKMAKDTMPLYIDNAKSYAGLAAGALGLTIIFREKVLGETGPVRRSFPLFSSWVAFLLTIVASGFYQWLAVRWMEKRLEATYGVTDNYPPLNFGISPQIAYGTMLVTFFLGAVFLFYGSARQLFGGVKVDATVSVKADKSQYVRWIVVAVLCLGIVTAVFLTVRRNPAGTDCRKPQADVQSHSLQEQ